MKPKANTIYKGDCIEIMRTWGDDCIDHCIVDPPYNMSKKKGLGWSFSSHVTMNEKWDIFSRKGYLQFTKSWLSEVCRVVKPNGNIFVFGSFHNIYDLGYLINEMDLKILNSIVWFKPNAQPNITCRMFTESTEHAIWACNAPKKKATGWVFNYDVAKKLNGGKQMRNMWSIPYPSAKERRFGKHPSQKAINVILRAILLLTNPGELILDCFAGTGTTGVVAQNFGRKWVMIDNNHEYIKIAKARLRNVKIPLPRELTSTEKINEM
mgnify:CR=1 FL=1